MGGRGNLILIGSFILFFVLIKILQFIMQIFEKAEIIRCGAENVKKQMWNKNAKMNGSRKMNKSLKWEKQLEKWVVFMVTKLNGQQKEKQNQNYSK